MQSAESETIYKKCQKQKKMFNKKPETKTIAARCKGGGCQVGRVEGEGDYSLQKVPASRCLRAPCRETQSEQQSLREMQEK